MRRFALAIVVALILGGPLLVIPDLRPWRVTATLLESVQGRNHGDSGGESGERNWILRHTFVEGALTNRGADVDNGRQTGPPIERSGDDRRLASDLEQRLLECGALGLTVARSPESSGVIICRCQLEVPGTPYLRRFECRDVTADLAGRRLLLELQKWSAAHSRRQDSRKF